MLHAVKGASSGALEVRVANYNHAAMVRALSSQWLASDVCTVSGSWIQR
jgi:hypothetical protein